MVIVTLAEALPLALSLEDVLSLPLPVFVEVGETVVEVETVEEVEAESLAEKVCDTETDSLGLKVFVKV